MYDSLASKIRTWVLVGLVGLLCLVFILQFGGPQSQGCTSGGAPSFAVRVYDQRVSVSQFEASYLLANFQRYPIELQKAQGFRQLLAEGFVDRALLAREARRLGFHMGEDDIWKRLTKDDSALVSIGGPRGGAQRARLGLFDEHGVFDVKRAKSVIQNLLHQSETEFADGQIEEQLAQRMREVIEVNVTVSPREVWDAFALEQDKARIAYALFSPATYRDTLAVDQAALSQWMDAHKDAVEAAYTANKHRYTGLEPQVRSRHILIKVAPDATEAQKAAAKARAEDIRKKALAGADFAELAKKYSDDQATARQGGDLGYNVQGRIAKPLDQAQRALKVGEVSGVLSTDYGFDVLKVIGKREGDVPEAEAKRELAHDLYLDSRADDAAKAAAERVLAAVRGGASLDDAVAAEDAKLGDDAPAKPEATTTRSFGRADDPISGPFDSGPLVNQVFAMPPDEKLPAEPLQLGKEYIVYELLDRERPDRKDFTDDAQQRLRDGLRSAKARDALDAYVDGLRKQAQTDGAIKINPVVLSYENARQS